MRRPIFFIFSDKGGEHYLNIDDISRVSVRDKTATVHLRAGGQVAVGGDSCLALMKLLGGFSQLAESENDNASPAS